MTGIGRRATGLEGNLGPQPERFGQVFGEGRFPRVFHAPGRVNLMGAHLDYNGGPVMPMAIDRGTWAALREVQGDELALASTREPGVRRFPWAHLPAAPCGSWVDYVLGVARALLPHGPPRPGGLQIDFGGDLPVGAGLSSSASLCLVSAFALDALWRLGRSPRELVQAALESERGFVGLPCGIMDPFAIGLARRGSVLWLDCADESHAYLPIDLERVGVAVADSGVRRKLGEVDYGLRVRECARAAAILTPRQPGAVHLCDVEWETWRAAGDDLSRAERRRVRHVLSDRDRTRLARQALGDGDLAQLGRLMLATHESLRADFEVSCPELDQLVQDASEVEGVLGARLTGAGFGGCAVILHERGARADLGEALRPRFRARFGREPRLWFFDGADGPRELARLE